MSAAQRAFKVLVVTLRYPPYVAGGYELLTRDAVEALRERGHQVSVLTGSGRELEHQAQLYPWLRPELDAHADLFERSFQGSNFERFGFHFYSRHNARATQRAIRASGAELVFYFNLGLVSLAPIVAARRAHVPSLGYISDSWPINHWLEAWRKDPRRQKKRLRLRLLELLWRGFRAWVRPLPLLTCSDFLRAKLAASGLPAEQLKSVRLGVPPDMQALAAGLPRPARAPDEPLSIACTSSFWEGKGQTVLLAALAQLHAKGVPFQLTLAGSGQGAYLERLKREAEQLDGRARFEHDLSRQEISKLLARSHVLVLPSTWDEPFPLATLEGMVHGCVPVVSSAGGSGEAIVDGIHGLVVPPGDCGALADALERLARDEALRARLGCAAQERARSSLSHGAFIDALEAAMGAALGVESRTR